MLQIEWGFNCLFKVFAVTSPICVCVCGCVVGWFASPRLIGLVWRRDCGVIECEIGLFWAVSERDVRVQSVRRYCVLL